jgi:hypothetical protein
MKIFAGEQVSRYTDAQMFLCTDGHLHRFAVCPPVLVQLSHHGMFGLDNVTVTFIDIVQKRFHHVRHIMHLHLSIVGQDLPGSGCSPTGNVCFMLCYKGLQLVKSFYLALHQQVIIGCHGITDHGAEGMVISRSLHKQFLQIDLLEILFKNASCEPFFQSAFSGKWTLVGLQGPQGTTCVIYRHRLNETWQPRKKINLI